MQNNVTRSTSGRDRSPTYTKRADRSDAQSDAASVHDEAAAPLRPAVLHAFRHDLPTPSTSAPADVFGPVPAGDDVGRSESGAPCASDAPVPSPTLDAIFAEQDQRIAAALDRLARDRARSSTTDVRQARQSPQPKASTDALSSGIAPSSTSSNESAPVPMGASSRSPGSAHWPAPGFTTTALGLDTESVPSGNILDPASPDMEGLREHETYASKPRLTRTLIQQGLQACFPDADAFRGHSFTWVRRKLEWEFGRKLDIAFVHAVMKRRFPQHWEVPPATKIANALDAVEKCLAVEPNGVPQIRDIVALCSKACSERTASGVISGSYGARSRWEKRSKWLSELSDLEKRAAIDRLKLQTVASILASADTADREPAAKRPRRAIDALQEPSSARQTLSGSAGRSPRAHHAGPMQPTSPADADYESGVRALVDQARRQAVAHDSQGSASSSVFTASTYTRPSDVLRSVDITTRPFAPPLALDASRFVRQSNPGGGNCLLHALEGATLTVEQARDLRLRMAQLVENSPDVFGGPALNAMRLATSLQQRAATTLPIDELVQGLELPNRHYAAFIALDGHYLGYEDIALYCRLHDDDHGVTSAPLRVTVVTPSGELVSVTAHHETTIRPANQGEAEEAVRQAFVRGDVVLVHQGAHFERARGFT